MDFIITLLVIIVVYIAYTIYESHQDYKKRLEDYKIAAYLGKMPQDMDVVKMDLNISKVGYPKPLVFTVERNTWLTREFLVYDITIKKGTIEFINPVHLKKGDVMCLRYQL